MHHGIYEIPLLVSLSIRRFWGKGEKKNLLSPNPVGRPDTQATLWSRRYNLYIYIFFVFKCHCFFKTVNLTLVVALNRSSLMKNCIRQMWQVSLDSISCFLRSSCVSFTLIVREAWENWKEMKLYCYKNQ